MPHPVVSRLGGVRPVARHLGVNPSTVSRWRERIPQRYWARLVLYAMARGVRLAATIDGLVTR